MLCPNCGQEFPEHDTICPGCGWEIDGEAAPETAAPEIEAEAAETVPAEADAEDAGETPEAAPADAAEDAPEADAEEAAGEAEASEETAGEAPEAQKKKAPTATIVLAAVAGLLLIIVVCLAVTLTTMSKGGNSGGTPQETVYYGNGDKKSGVGPFFQKLLHGTSFQADSIAARVLDESGSEVASLTNEQMSFYYWGEFYYFIQASGMPFDPAQPLSQQEYAEGESWQDYFLESAGISIQQVEGMKAEANAAGYVMPEEYQTQYESILASMPDYALQSGFADENGNGDVLAYVQDSYGAAATVETFEQYLYDSYFVTAYSDSLYDGIAVDSSELEGWYDDNAEMYEAYGVLKSDQPDISVRHILIAPAETAEDATETEIQAAKDAAREEAERILKEWQDGEATEERFGELANTYSTDGGSNTNGGLYEDVYPGQMVQAFNDWCFDPERKPGDTGIVETDFGYHIMYFVGTTDSYYWKTAVEGDLHYQKYNEALEAIVDKYSVTTTDQLEIVTPTAISTLAENAAAQAAG